MCGGGVGLGAGAHLAGEVGTVVFVSVKGDEDDLILDRDHRRAAEAAPGGAQVGVVPALRGGFVGAAGERRPADGGIVRDRGKVGDADGSGRAVRVERRSRDEQLPPEERAHLGPPPTT